MGAALYAGVQWDLNTFSCDYENLCPADIVKDGFVAVDDLLELLAPSGTHAKKLLSWAQGSSA